MKGNAYYLTALPSHEDISKQRIRQFLAATMPFNAGVCRYQMFEDGKIAVPKAWGIYRVRARWSMCKWLFGSCAIDSCFGFLRSWQQW